MGRNLPGLSWLLVFIPGSFRFRFRVSARLRPATRPSGSIFLPCVRHMNESLPQVFWTAAPSHRILQLLLSVSGPGSGNNPPNLTIIAAGLGNMSPKDREPQSPQKSIPLRPSRGGPATQGDVDTVDWVLKNISSACVTATERGRERGGVCGVTGAAPGCPGWPGSIKAPREGPRGRTIAPEYRQAA